MEKYSVKKPFTVLVAVIMVLALGFVSITGMRTDLLPEFNIPYLMVITVYPGASPERVESEVSQLMERNLGTISGVKNVTTTSSENYSMVQLEFEGDVNMDSAMVKVSSAVQQIQGSLPDMCMTPSIVELSMDMLATMYVTASREGYDVYQLSDFVRNTVYPTIERQNGVSSVSSTGLVEKYIQIELNQAKIDDVNDRLLVQVSDTLAEAKEQMDTAQAQVESGIAALNAAQKGFGSTMSDMLFGQVSGGVESVVKQLRTQLDNVHSGLTDLNEKITDPALQAAVQQAADSVRTLRETLGQKYTLGHFINIISQTRTVLRDVRAALQAVRDSLMPADDGEEETARPVLPEGERLSIEQALAGLNDMLGRADGLLDSAPSLVDGLETAFAGMTQGQLDAAVQFATMQTQLEQGRQQLETAKAQYESARESALSQANLGALLNLNTLSMMIYAQNFAMPAGYIDDKEDNSWLLKVGEEFSGPVELADTLLVSMDGLGDVKVSDVADVQVIDNSQDAFARMNGEPAVIINIFKGSTASTSEVSNSCLAAFEEMEAKYPGLHLVTLVNQGMYIDMIVSSVVKSMLIGALLAILVLALFLKDIKPTLVVGISIPLSVLFAIVLMYFTDMTLNTMTLGGLSLGIGMLVDNSIVVIENIYRLRSRGVSAPRAAVQGARQVEGAVIASTLTTVCVFLPLVFTDGTVRQLLVPLGLCIGYCLLASLVVALTVAPASASTILRKATPKQHPWFDKLQDVYGDTLGWCLKHKTVPMLVTIGLLAFCVWRVTIMGIVMLPDVSSGEISIQVRTPDGLTREESYAIAGEFMEIAMGIDGIEEVGGMSTSSMTGMLGGALGSMGTGSRYGDYTYYVTTSTSSKAVLDRITADLEAASADLNAEVRVTNGSAMDTSMLTGGSGVSVNVYGTDLETLQKFSEDVMEVINGTEGFSEASNGMEDGDPTIHLVIDRDKAMAAGFTVAQIFQEISARMTTSTTSTTVRMDGSSVDVKLVSKLEPLTLENLLDLPLKAASYSSGTGSSSGSAMSGMGAGSTAVSTPKSYTLGDFATLEYTVSSASVRRLNGSRYMTVSGKTEEGYNTTVQSRLLASRLEEFEAAGRIPDGCWYTIGGETSAVNDMLTKMIQMLLLGGLFVYLVMVAQFQSLLSPFIVMFTIPLAFTGGMIGLLVTNQQLSVMSLMGFVMLMGTVVNNGIVFVDYVNQLRIGGMERHPALIATGKTRMRPILMTAMTTILAMFQMLLSDDMSGQLMGGMVTVIVGGLIYATFMTLYIVPIMYDILFKRPPLQVDVGSDNLDDVPDDAAEFIAESLRRNQPKNA